MEKYFFVRINGTWHIGHDGPVLVLTLCGFSCCPEPIDQQEEEPINNKCQRCWYSKEFLDNRG